MNIYVGNLDYKVVEEDIKSLFEEFGSVSSVKIIMDKYTGKSKGFAFVEMENDEDAKRAIDECNNRTLGSRPLKVNEARPRKEF